MAGRSQRSPASADTSAAHSVVFPAPGDLSNSAEDEFLNRSQPTTGAQSSASAPQEKFEPSPGFMGQVEKKILGFKTKQLTLNSGAFHYHVRAGTYGDIYDEIPWRVKMGLESEKDRSVLDRTSWLGQYSNQTLIHGWSEERRDSSYIKNKRSPPISQYGYLYTTTYGSTIGNKRNCNRERAILQYMKAIPSGAVPAHQPELDIAMHRCCLPKPQVCLDQDARDICRKEAEVERRADKAAA